MGERTDGIGVDDELGTLASDMDRKDDSAESETSLSEDALCQNCRRPLVVCRDPQTGAASCVRKPAVALAVKGPEDALAFLISGGTDVASAANARAALGDLLVESMQRRVQDNAERDQLKETAERLERELALTRDRLTGRVRSDVPLMFARGSRSPVAPERFVTAMLAHMADAGVSIDAVDDLELSMPADPGGVVKIVGAGLDKTSAFWSTHVVAGEAVPAQILLDVQRIYVEEGVEVVTFRKL